MVVRAEESEVVSFGGHEIDGNDGAGSELLVSEGTRVIWTAPFW